MDCTTLNLLTRDGAVEVVFTPPLDAEHYSELFNISRDANSAAELSESVQEAAARWGRQVEVI